MRRMILGTYAMVLALSLLYQLTCGVLMRLANQQVERKNPREALRYYEILGKIAPGSPDILIWQAWRHYELGNLKEARNLAEKGRRKNPEGEEVRRLLGQLAYEEGKFEEALDYWKDDPMGQAWAYYQLGRLQEARQCLSRCNVDEPGLNDLKIALEEQKETPGPNRHSP